MLSFENDYSEGAHEKILQAFLETNMEKTSGYGNDPFTESAKEKIRTACECPDADVYFLTGGTQTNKTIIATMLQPYQGVVAATSGHVSVHEAGAIEFTRHKVLTVPAEEGKIRADVLQQFVADFYADGNYEHMVFPGMVYISQPTEYGTLYSKAELEQIYSVCKAYEMPLFMDGARLGYGLVSPACDVTLPELAKLCDVFYIGGTKVGALCGEAVVFPRGNMPKHFVTMVKQHGSMIAKGRLLGIQFDVLFTDNLYFEIAKNAITTAERVKEILKEKGYQFYLDSPTNQIFVVVENAKYAELSKQMKVSFIEKADDNHTVIRFCTSWATKMEDVEALAAFL